MIVIHLASDGSCTYPCFAETSEAKLGKGSKAEGVKEVTDLRGLLALLASTKQTSELG